MADVNYTAAARAFNRIDAYLKAKNWKYDKDVEKFQFTYQVGGDDLPMRFTLFVDPEREMIRSLSFMPFDFAEDKRIEGAVAVCVANYGMVNGCFAYDISDGTVFHKLAVSYKDTEVTDEMITYIMGLGMAMVDKYNDRFFALNKGYISISDFMKDE
jgi:hypothetical protein